MAGLMQLIVGLSKTQGRKELTPPAHPQETFIILGSLQEKQLLSISGLHIAKDGISQTG